MGVLGFYTCLCLSVIIAAVSAQLRPIVQAPPLPDSDISIILAECNRRIAINSSIAHQVMVPSDCSMYAACEHPEIGVEAAVMTCAPGLFFNDDMDVVTCVRAPEIDCPASADPCSGRPDGYNQDGIRSQDLQGAYINCRGGRTVGGGWCELGEQYLSLETACQQILDRPIPAPRTTPAYDCPLSAIAEDSSRYMSEGISMPCAPGTVYSAEMCTCV